MNELRDDFKETSRDILEYLSSLRLLSSDLDVEISTKRHNGLIQVRGGGVVAASQGVLSGNGALFTLTSQRVGDIKATVSSEPLVHDVTVSHEQMVLICDKVSGVVGANTIIDEAEFLQDAIHLLLQFRKKEAIAKLVELLRYNRFYYPAWLWHSRLMNHTGYLVKAANEMKKWGGHDALVKSELAKLGIHRLKEQQVVKRCLFCWAIIEHGQKQCGNCNCILSVSAKEDDQVQGNQELENALERYANEFDNNPQNSRIAYCLCLGSFSLGRTELAKNYLDKALRISPDEQLFHKTSTFLKNSKEVTPDPLKKNKNEKVETAPVPSFQPAAIPSKNKTILLIEDSTTSRKVISLVLKRQGYIIVEAITGNEGLARLDDSFPDLVLLDVMLPDMDGYEILTKIRMSSRLKEVPVVMLTGKRSSIDRMKGLSSGANEYLTKPFDPAKLLKIIERFIHTGKKNKVATVEPPSKPTPTPAVKKPLKSRPLPQLKRIPEKTMQTAGPAILVVEDSPTAQKVISMILTRKGYPLRLATTGEEALQAIENNVPDLILLDAMLPDMSGYTILVHLQKDEKLKKIPVVMLTAKKSAADRQKGMQAGAVAYLTKPFDPNKLLSTVMQYMPLSSLATN